MNITSLAKRYNLFTGNHFKWLKRTVTMLFDHKTSEFIGIVIRIFSTEGRPILFCFGPCYTFWVLFKPKFIINFSNMKTSYIEYIKNDFSEALKKPLSKEKITELRKQYDDYGCIYDK